MDGRPIVGAAWRDETARKRLWTGVTCREAWNWEGHEARFMDLGSTYCICPPGYRECAGFILLRRVI